jgi:hypothetical protein
MQSATSTTFCQFFAARSIIELAMRPRKLPVTEWTECCLAAVPTCVVNPPASPERYVADVPQLLIVICSCRKLAGQC